MSKKTKVENRQEQVKHRVQLVKMKKKDKLKGTCYYSYIYWMNINSKKTFNQDITP